MFGKIVMVALIGAALAVGMTSAPAYAQATRTWVSGVGDDANPCSRTAPCKTFAGAISKTAAGGEINCLDPGGFGAVTITKSISIICEFEAGVLVSGTNGIIVSGTAGTERVILDGLDFDGLGTGLDGVKILSAGVVYIRNSSIRGFANGVEMADAHAGGRVFMQNVFITNNTTGVYLHGAGNIASILDSLIDGNTTTALKSDTSGNVFGVVRSTITNSPTGIDLTNGALAISFGPSNVISGAGAFTSTSNFK